MQNRIQGFADLDGPGHVLLEKPEAGMLFQVGKISRRSGKKIVEPDYGVALGEEAVAEMGPYEPGGPRKNDTQTKPPVDPTL